MHHYCPVYDSWSYGVDIFIHLELSFVQGHNYVYICNLLNAAVYFEQYHLLKMLPFLQVNNSGSLL